MGGRCCTDRKSAAEIAREQARGRQGSISLMYQSKGMDADQFDKAFQNNDLKAFVALLRSCQPIESFRQQIHPWARDPKTIGALAGTQLAILASGAEREDPNVKLRIYEAGAVPPLLDFLRSGEEDRIETSVVAFSFLTAECPEICIAAYDGGALELLVAHLDSQVAGMRAAAATTLRNICMVDQEYRAHLVRLGGISGLVSQLSVPPDPALHHADVQLEAVLNLQDMLELENGDLIEEYALRAVDEGAIPKLTSLSQEDDEEVRSSAFELLQSLEKLSMEYRGSLEKLETSAASTNLQVI